MSNKAILVTGDTSIEQHIYEDPKNGCNTLIVEQRGGAVLLYNLLNSIAKDNGGLSFSVACGIDDTTNFSLPRRLSLWNICPSAEKSGKNSWKRSRALGCAGSRSQTMPEQPAPSPSFPEIVLIHDQARYFRHATNRHLWPEAVLTEKTDKLERIVLNMTAPLAQGDLWRHLTSSFKEKLTVIISLNDILQEESGITHGISWERTLEGLIFEFLNNGAVKDLLNCSHLIVRIGTCGALWVKPTNGEEPFFSATIDPARLDNDQALEPEEASLCFAAALTAGLAAGNDHAIPLVIRSGLKAIQALARLGYLQDAKQPPSFPYANIAATINTKPEGLRDIPVPSRPDHSWSIMGDDPSNNLGIARRVALFGPRALDNIPYKEFGKLTVVDRSEIESLLGLRQLLKGYIEQKKAVRPLSLAVFGAPGSGKSFGIKQIAGEILGDDCKILEFNLSQFAGPVELIGAFHQVRDKVLEGFTPLVFWDEFDSKNLEWLQFLLAPMQDGKFQEGQLTHPIGKCIFIFAGGTSYTMENFSPPTENREATEKFKLLKGPDFISRLNGYLNVLGPNPRQRFDAKEMKWVRDDINPDSCYPIRRALLIRSMLKLKPGQTLEIDQGVLTALLEIDQFKHGARSLETVINLTGRNSTRLLRSNLPPEQQLSLHVEYKQFMNIVARDVPFRMNAELLAPYIHEFYRNLSKSNVWEFKYNMDYKQLPAEIKADNVAAAARIPTILSLAGLRLKNEEGSILSMSDTEYRAIIEPHLELLAEIEHQGWMDQKYRSGWMHGATRNDDLKIHSALDDYANLSEQDKEKDRNAIRDYIKVVKNAGYAVVKAGLSEKQ